MASETYLPLDSGCLYVRHSAIQQGRPSLVFLHGLGESGLSFSEAFDRPEMAGFNLIVPDLLGFGRSSAAIGADYTFDAQAARLWRALDILDVETVILIGHSMGGDLATLMTSWKRERVKSLINVEGNLTPEDLFISKKATGWGAKSLADETQKFLVTAGIQQKRFAGASHWLMADQPWTFYPFLREFCANV